MKRTIVTAAGDVVCPSCGAKNSFMQKRTGKAKLVGVATVGVGVVAMPKRLKCNGCGANLKRGGLAAQQGRGRYRAVEMAPAMSVRAKLIMAGLVVLFVLVSYLVQH